MAATIRRAVRNDAPHVAALMDMAGHGIEAEYWALNRDADGSILAAARHRILHDESLPYHISKAYMLEEEGEVVGALIGGPASREAAIPGGFPDYFAPLLELEAGSDGDWVVICVSVYPEHRGKGHGSELLAHAAALGRASRARGLSLVVEDSNAKALALYRRHGFTEADRRPWLPYAGRKGPENWLLLTRSL